MSRGLSDVELPPRPHTFFPATNVTFVALADSEPAFVRAAKKRATGKRAEGLRYERRAKEELLHTFSGMFTEGPWLVYRNAHGPLRWCQPDGLLVDLALGHCTILEIKYKHTSDAWWQLWWLYMPTLRALLPGYSFSAVEVVRWYDPAVYFPQSIMLADLRRPLPAPFTGIHVLRV